RNRSVGRGHVGLLKNGAGQSFSSRFSVCSPLTMVGFRSVFRCDLYLSGNVIVGLVCCIPDSFCLASAALAGSMPFKEGTPDDPPGCTTTLYSPGGTSEVRKVPSWVTGMVMLLAPSTE